MTRLNQTRDIDSFITVARMNENPGRLNSSKLPLRHRYNGKRKNKSVFNLKWANYSSTLFCFIKLIYSYLLYVMYHIVTIGTLKV